MKTERKIDMRKTQETATTMNGVLCIPRAELPKLLGCGQMTAERIARESGARIKIGKRVLIKLDKVQAYLDSVAE